MDIKVSSKYTTDFLPVLSVLVGSCWQGLCIHLGVYNTLKPELALNLIMRNRSSSSTPIKCI
jgi:hypothetical protein